MDAWGGCLPAGLPGWRPAAFSQQLQRLAGIVSGLTPERSLSRAPAMSVLFIAFGRAIAPEGNAAEGNAEPWWGGSWVQGCQHSTAGAWGSAEKLCLQATDIISTTQTCFRALPVLRAKPYLCHWCSLCNNEHKGVSNSHCEQPGCLQHRLHAGGRLERGGGPGQWVSGCARLPWFTL